MVLQIDEAAAAAASLEAWGGAARRERDAAVALLELAVEPPTTRPAHAAPTPPIWQRLEELPDLVGEPRATSTPLPRRLPPPPRRRLRRRDWKPLERVSVLCSGSQPRGRSRVASRSKKNCEFLLHRSAICRD